jgi:hypothetical protein
MMERGSFLYVLNSDNSLHVFDMFGAWKKSLTIDATLNWEADSGRVLLFGVDGRMRIIDVKLWQTFEVQLPVSGGQYSYHSPYLYCLRNNVLSVFKHVENARN